MDRTMLLWTPPNVSIYCVMTFAFFHASAPTYVIYNNIFHIIIDSGYRTVLLVEQVFLLQVYMVYMVMTQYYVYWIVSDNKSSYIGATVDPRRRLRQHNGELVGGASRTRGKLWHFHRVIRGFRTWKEALQAEWALKYYSRRCRGIATREAAFDRVLSMTRWTSNSPLASEVPLDVECLPTQYGEPPDARPSESKGGRSTTGKTSSRQFKRNLHGVRY